MLKSIIVFICAAVQLGMADKPVSSPSLVASELSFAKRCQEVGVRASFIEYFADDGIAFKPEPFRYTETVKTLPPQPNPKAIQLVWEPQCAGIAASGELGFTTGPSVMVKLEREFSKACANEGTLQAYLSRTEGSTRLHRQNHLPIVGTEAIKTHLGKEPPVSSWSPMGSDVSLADDLGYSYGTYEIKKSSDGSAIEKGYYLHLWKRKPKLCCFQSRNFLRLCTPVIGREFSHLHGVESI